jgi:hypothetical protein
MESIAIGSVWLTHQNRCVQRYPEAKRETRRHSHIFKLVTAYVRNSGGYYFYSHKIVPLSGIE